MSENESIVVTLPEVGEVLLERSYRAKNINISVKPPKKVRVAIPVGVDFERARIIVEKRGNWIKEKIKEFANSSTIHLKNTYSSEELIFHKRLLTKRVDILSRRYGFKYNKLKFRLMKSRWGSCSAKNNICLNLLMASLPKKLQDYIIIHELVHTKIKNHSRTYWTFMNKIIVDAKSMHKELKEKYTINY